MAEFIEKPDFFEQLRAQQRATADTLRKPLQRKLEAQFRQRLGEAARKAQLDPAALDQEAARAFLEGELERDVFVALVGYSTWLATRLYQQHRDSSPALNDRQVILPECGQADLELIATEYGVEVDFLRLVMDLIHSQRGRFEVPGIGHLESGTLAPNTQALKNWANYYEW